MKEMPIFEEVFARVVRQSGFWIKMLVGGLLSFVPVLNLFAFGYLYRLSNSAQKRGGVTLPDWSDWKGLFTDGLKFAVVWLAYWLLPMLLAFGVSSLLGWIGLGALAYLVVSLVFVLSPIIFGAALYRYNRRGEFQDLLDVVLIIRMSYHAFPRQIVPALFFCGVFALCPPLYGFSLFFGFTLLILQTVLSFRSVERRSIAL